MTDFNYKRLEDLIESTWRGKDEKKCLWWQGEWWSWARFAALTDDCAAVMLLDAEVFLTEGSEENLKLTTPSDVYAAEAILAERGED